VAPFLIGNVLWILREAARRDLKKLFFIARDGQVLLDIALELANKVGYHGELKYLYGSRQAWVPPSLKTLDAAAFDAICPIDGDVDERTLRLVLSRFDVPAESIESHLTESGFTSRSLDSHLDDEARLRLRALLVENADVRGEVFRIAAENRALVLDYLQQEGVITDDSIGIIHQGTGSTLYNALGALLATVDQAPPHGFYFGLRADAPDRGFGEPQTYIRNERRPTGFLSTPGLLTLTEMACSADHGSVVGYRREGEEVLVNLAQENFAAVDWGFLVVRRVVRSVAAHLAVVPFVIPEHIDLRPATIDGFENFWKHPTASEARVWGSYPFEDGWGEDSVTVPLATKQHLISVIRPAPHRHWWGGGAQALSRPLPRTIMRSRADAIRIARRAKRKFVH
jgi:hypothetical protein